MSDKLAQFAVFSVLFMFVGGQSLAQSTFNFFLTGSQEVPPSGSDAFGHCRAVLNEAETELAITCVHNVEAPEAAHIHMAPAGENGPIVFPFESAESPIEATWDLSAEDVDDLLAGDLYVNVHTEELPDGAIRGQMVNAETAFDFFLESRQEVPLAISTARGHCRGVLNEDHTEFALECHHTVEDATAAHIHEAPVGVAGPIIFGLGEPTSPIQQTWEPDQDEVNNLFDGNLYVNVHSDIYPAGEVRGQIARMEVTLNFPLEASQENPPADSTAAGSCVGVLNEGHITFALHCVHTVTEPTATHIHEAPRGVNGPVIFGLGDPASPIVATWEPSAEEVTDLVSGNLYVNVHSPTFPGGEVRGQIVLPGPRVNHIAQVGNGEGIVTDLVLTNTSGSTAVAGRVEFRGGEGERIDFGLAELPGIQPLQSFVMGTEFSIEPLGSVTISTDGLGDQQAGAARILSEGGVGAIARFGIPAAGIAGVGVSEPLTHFIIPVRRIAGGIDTGVALQNTSETSVTITLTLRDEDGEAVPDGITVLEDFPALGHTAQFISELFQDADTDDFRGTLEVEVEGGEVAATALELGPEPGEFTALPVNRID